MHFEGPRFKTITFNFSHSGSYSSNYLNTLQETHGQEWPQTQTHKIHHIHTRSELLHRHTQELHIQVCSHVQLPTMVSVCDILFHGLVTVVSALLPTIVTN